MTIAEDFSVNQLKKFHHYSETGNSEQLDRLAAKNIGNSGMREYDIQANLPTMDESQRVSNIIHDAVVELYEQNNNLTADQAYDFIRTEIEDKGDLEDEFSKALVYRADLEETVEAISENIAENFVSGQDVRTEELLENRGLRGRADIIREVDGLTELRDIKTKYSSEPRPYDEFGLACYALASRSDHDIDRFVLEYPVQGFEVEVNPEDWFSLIVERATQFEDMLDETRELQAEQIREYLDNSDKTDREKVEKLGLNPARARELARKARGL